MRLGRPWSSTTTLVGRSSVRWHVGSDTVTMSSSTGLYRLHGAVTNIRPATAEEWTVSLCPDPLIARFEVRIYSVAGIMGDVPIALDSLHQFASTSR